MLKNETKGVCVCFRNPRIGACAHVCMRVCCSQGPCPCHCPCPWTKPSAARACSLRVQCTATQVWVRTYGPPRPCLLPSPPLPPPLLSAPSLTLSPVREHVGGPRLAALRGERLPEQLHVVAGVAQAATVKAAEA